MSTEKDAGDELDDTLAALAEAADEVIHPTRPADLGSIKTRRDDDGRIESDLICVGCQYNLRGQLPDGTCPECGEPIEKSLKSDHLRFANLVWLRSIKSGLSLIIIATIAGFVVNGLFQLIARVILSNQRGRYSRLPTSFGELDLALQVSVIMEFVVYLVPMVLLCIGYWQFTKPEPKAKALVVSQQLTRWSLISSYALLIGLRLYILLSIILFLDFPRSKAVAIALIATVAVILFVGFPATMVYLRSFARRLPSRKLMRHTTIVLWGFVSCFAALGLLVVAAIFIRALSRNGLAVFLLASPMLLGIIVFSIWWIVLLFVYQGRVAKSIGSARRLRRASKLDPGRAHEAVS